MNAVFLMLRVVALVALVVEVIALFAGETLVLNLAFVLGLGALTVAWVLRQDGEER